LKSSLGTTGGGATLMKCWRSLRRGTGIQSNRRWLFLIRSFGRKCYLIGQDGSQSEGDSEISMAIQPVDLRD
jgi:hypothetical protein